jgi:hypothetical protein
LATYIKRFEEMLSYSDPSGIEDGKHLEYFYIKHDTLA